MRRRSFGAGLGVTFRWYDGLAGQLININCGRPVDKSPAAVVNGCAGHID